MWISNRLQFDLLNRELGWKVGLDGLLNRSIWQKTSNLTSNKKTFRTVKTLGFYGKYLFAVIHTSTPHCLNNCIHACKHTWLMQKLHIISTMCLLPFSLLVHHFIRLQHLSISHHQLWVLFLFCGLHTPRPWPLTVFKWNICLFVFLFIFIIFLI